METKGSKISLPDSSGKIVKLADFLGKYIVLYFYPKDDTPGCTIEAIDFSKHMSDFEKQNAVVIGISPDSLQSHCKFIEKRDLKIILLSDKNKSAIESYKCWGKKKFMGREFMGVIRSTFIIDPNGLIVKEWRNVSVKNHVIEVLDALKKIQPSNWQ